MPIEFTQYPSPENTGVSGDTLFRLTVAYDGTGRRISKTRWVKAQGDAGWSRGHVTHYTGIGTEVRENFAEPAKETKVVVNMPVFFRVTLTRLKPRSYIEKDILRLSNGGAILPKQSFGASRQGLGRYGIEDADRMAEDGTAQTFEWFLKNHLGSTMLVYGTGGTSGGLKAAYDYRSFGEQVELTTPPTGKVTENFTGKELDDETQLDYFGARYLDPMLGVWISVDPMRQFASPYLYAGNGMNPIGGGDSDGNYFNPFGVFIGVGTGLAASLDAQTEYRRVSGENYNPATEAAIGAAVYVAYVLAGAVGIKGGLLKSTLLAGFIGGSLSGGSIALAEGAGAGNLEGIDGDKVAEGFTKGAVSAAFGSMLGAGFTELMGGAAPAGFDFPSSAEAVGGAAGGFAGFVLDRCSTFEWDKDSEE